VPFPGRRRGSPGKPSNGHQPHAAAVSSPCRSHTHSPESIPPRTSRTRPAVVQWSKGEYAGASNTQDDLALISRHLAQRADDHGDGPGAATLLHPDALELAGPGRAAAGAAGNIERTGDADWFAFDAGGAGEAALAVDLVPDAPVPGVPPLFVRANADVKLAVYGPLPADAPPGAAPPQLLAAFDPQGALLRGSVSAALPGAGRYLVSVTGTGDGSDATSGYTSYGSLGEYRLRVEYPAAAAPDGVTGGGGGGDTGGVGGSGGPVPADLRGEAPGLNSRTSAQRLRVKVRERRKGREGRRGPCTRA
jgi:hypothetical protein